MSLVRMVNRLYNYSNIGGLSMSSLEYELFNSKV